MNTKAQQCRNEAPTAPDLVETAWNEGFEFARGRWHDAGTPDIEGLYAVRNTEGDTIIGMWVAKATNGVAAHWSLGDWTIEPDDVVAWFYIPEYAPNT